MNIGIYYVITSLVCLLVIVLIINRTRRTKYKATIDAYFCNMLYFFAFFCCVDTAWGVFSARAFVINKDAFTVASYGFHSVAAISAYVWFGYILYYARIDRSDKLVLNYLRHILLVIQVIVISSNHINHNAFWVDDNCNYYTGPMRNALYCLQFSYYTLLILYMIGMALKCDSKNRKLYLDAIIFSFVPLGFGLLQYLFYDMALYSIGFMVSAFIIYCYNVTAQREEFLEEKFNTLDRKQSSIISGLAGNFVSIYFVDIKTGNFEIYQRDEEKGGIIKSVNQENNYFETVLINGKKLLEIDAYEEFEEKFSKERIIDEIKEKGEYYQTLRLSYKNQLKYFQYRFVKPYGEEADNKLIVGVYDVDSEIKSEQKRQEERRQLYYDALTGLYNRRTYEDDLKKINRRVVNNELVYISLDVNELKIVNDSLGHEAGDELIRAAANCMKKAFSQFGKIYRVGGDEFVAIIYANTEQLDACVGILDEAMESWKGKRFDNLSISYGISLQSDNPDMKIKELADLADKQMYSRKAKYYAKKGIDRKGQQDAYNAVCNSYTKIVKANLTTGEYTAIQFDLAEKNDKCGYDSNIYEWLRKFADSGNVHSKDLEFYYEHTKPDYLRNYFLDGNSFFCIYYRRLIGDSYKRVMLEIIPAKEYSADDEAVFFYVKNLER